MPEFVHYNVKDRVAVLTIDNPPVNALGPGVWDAIDEAVARAAADPRADAIVLTGAGQMFVAGADINIFKRLKTCDQALARSGGIHAMLRRLEDAAKPLVAAIHGHALGGGLEVAMACHYRIATRDAKVGQPEVLLGIIPGAGGTQRLPRLCGVTRALEMCAEGKLVPAPEAKTAGILDEIVEGDLLPGAIAYAKARAAAGDRRKTRDIAFTPEQVQKGLEACALARVNLAKTVKGTVAPYAVVNAIEAALMLDFDAGSLRERELSADCVVSTESKALRHLFFAEREAAKVPDVPRDTPTLEVRRAGVVGAGTMGGALAMSYANAAIPVLLKEVDQAALERGLATIRKNYEIAMSNGEMTADQLERTLALITPSTTYDGFDTLDIVFEAVSEQMNLKKTIFAELGRVTRPNCVLASSTSTLDIDAFAESSGRPSQVVGHHFFSPATVVKLVEIVGGRQTSKQVIATSVKLAKRLGKVPVVVGNCPGFVANRMLAHYMRELYLLLEEGASVPQIDRVLAEFGMPVGPFGQQTVDSQQSTVNRFEVGRYAQKTGAGWEEAVKRGITRRPVADDEILARVMTALANEGARMLEDGCAARPGDIDVICVHGFGFPRRRGGPMFYADTVGLPTLVERIEEYRTQLGGHWQPAPLLERLAAERRGFYSEPAQAADC